MRYGFIKAAAATPEIRVADCSYNAGQTVKLMREASEKGVKLLVFPELCITGYTCSDLFLQRRLLDGALTALRTVMEASRKLSLLTVAGLPLTVEDKLYNCAAVIFQGEILGVVPKTNLPNYNEFYEKRHFVPAPAENTVCRLFGKEVPFGSKLLFCCDTLSELKVAVEICEDLWSPIPPSNYHALAGATIIANPSASNEVIGKDAYRKELVGGQSGRLVCGYIYASAGEGESTTDLVFSGHNLIAENGAILAESRLFHNSLTISELDVQRLSGERRRLSSFPAVQDEGYQRIYFSLPVEKTNLSRIIDPRPFIPSEQSALKNRCETILSIQSLGLKKRLEHSRAKTAVVGISGGLDSTLALCVTARAMDLLNRPRTDIIAITMPCFGTTQRTKSNAEILAQRLGVTLERVDIAKQVLQHFEDIGHSPDDQDVTFENAQARTRTLVHIGCKRNMEQKPIEEALLQTLKEEGIHPLSLKCIATIPLKSDEPGIIGTAANLNVPLQIIPTEEIENLDISQLGIQTSEFVASQTGVLSVSTACSYLASGKGEILKDKVKYKGITIALSKERS